MRVALAELRWWVATTATHPTPDPAAMDTDFNEVGRTQKDTLDGLLSKFEFEGDTEEVKLTAEEKLLLREAHEKTKLG